MVLRLGSVEDIESDGLRDGRYRLLSVLGQGTGVTTYEAIDSRHNEICVLKCLRLSGLNQWKKLELFQREARILSLLEHARIPTLRDYFESEQAGGLICCLVLERVFGQTLARHAASGRVFGEAECLGLALQILDLLTYLHAFQPPVVHRDLKPSNLMLDDAGRVHLIDFGGVQEALALGAGGSTIVGTYGYMAPEQFAGKALPQSDLYALGATLVFLLSGREPATLPQTNLLLDFRDVVPCSERFANWIEQLLLPVPEQRFASAREARLVLEEILPGQAWLPAAQPAGRPPRRGVLEMPPPPLDPAGRRDLLVPGERVAGHYQIETLLGHGDVAATYAARDLRSQQPVVLRELHFDKLGDWKPFELFERECRALAQLRHDALPRLLDHFAAGPRWYLVSEFLAGQTLTAWLRQGWRPQEAEVIALARELLGVLAYLQAQHPPLIHRDIKPSNLLRTAEGRLALIDFGAVQEVLRPQGAQGSTVIGTFGYMAPEQSLGQAVPASDLYGLGATLIHLVTGRSPAELPRQGLQIAFAAQARCSPGLIRWLEKMVAPNLAERFASPAEAAEGLERLDWLPVATAPVRAQAAAFADAPDLRIREDFDGLQLQLRPMYHDYRQLVLLLLSGNLVVLPLLALMLPPLLPSLALPLLPAASLGFLTHFRRLGRRYETELHLDARCLSYRVSFDSEHGKEVKEAFQYPIETIAGLFLCHEPCANLLGLQLKDPLSGRIVRRRIARYPLCTSRRKAAMLLERLRDGLAQYQRLANSGGG